MNYHFHPEALHEYAGATQYYADISTSLAIGFVSQVEEGINLISREKYNYERNIFIK